jgi:hypothetical protein
MQQFGTKLRCRTSEGRQGRKISRKITPDKDAPALSGTSATIVARGVLQQLTAPRISFSNAIAKKKMVVPVPGVVVYITPCVCNTCEMAGLLAAIGPLGSE